MKEMVSNLPEKVGDEVQSVFILHDMKENKNEKTGWTSCTLSDRTGEVSALVWHEVPLAACKENSIVLVRALVTLWQGKPRLQIREMAPASEGSYDPSDLVPSLEEEELHDLRQRLMSLIRGITDAGLRTLVYCVFGRERFLKHYETLPGGHQHHLFNGGLLVHTVEVAEMAKMIAEKGNLNISHHPGAAPADIDLVVAGALLHDFGKCKEFKPFPFMERNSGSYYVGYQAEGDLYLVKLFEFLRKNVPEINIVKYEDRLRNIVLSCHCHYQRNVCPPRTKEARYILMADRISCDTEAYDACVSRRNPDSEGSELVYSEYFGSYIRGGGE